MARTMPLSRDGLELLQRLARESESGRAQANDGWLPYTPTYKPLVWIKLIEERDRTGGGVELRLTELGWSMLTDGIELAENGDSDAG